MHDMIVYNYFAYLVFYAPALKKPYTARLIVGCGIVGESRGPTLSKKSYLCVNRTSRFRDLHWPDHACANSS